MAFTHLINGCSVATAAELDVAGRGGGAAGSGSVPLPRAIGLADVGAAEVGVIDLADIGAPDLEVINPATGRVFARCPRAGRAELDAAVTAARNAFPAWAARSFAERAAAIKQMSARLREQQGELAQLLTQEQGKPIGQSRDEIGRAASQSEGMAGIEIPVEVLADDAQRRIELRYR